MNRRKAGRRKLRLFLCACARHIWKLIPRGAHRKAVELGERLCEGEEVAKRIAALGEPEVEGALWRRHAAHTAMACVGTNRWHAVVTGADAAAMAVGWSCLYAEGGEDHRIYQQGKDAEELVQAALLREIVGNPFHPVKLESAWLHWNDRTVVALAQ